MKRKNHNISLLPKEEQELIELQKQAAFWISKLKRHKCNRYDIEQAIADIEESQKEDFKAYLNYYKSL